MQIVYISNRPGMLADTMDSVSKFMPFIDSAMVVVPGALQAECKALNLSLPTQFVPDEKFDELQTHRSDHQSLNYYLRTSLSEVPEVEEEFIMSDDDARPLKSINMKFYKDDGKYRAYYFYDLAKWTHGTNSFDVGQRNTYQVLRYLDYPHLSYASHMPQIINKRILRAVRERFQSYSRVLSLCEWGTYFNYARKHHPEKFDTEQPYQTLCWPDTATSWVQQIEAPDYTFENYSPELYKSRGPFYDLDSMFSEELDMRFKKAISWHRRQTSVLRGEIADADTILRSLMYRVLRPLRRLKDVVWFEERSQLKALEHSVKIMQSTIANLENRDHKFSREK